MCFSQTASAAFALTVHAMQYGWAPLFTSGSAYSSPVEQYLRSCQQYVQEVSARVGKAIGRIAQMHRLWGMKNMSVALKMRHFFFFFFPTLLMSNNVARMTMVVALFTGPVLTQMLAALYMDTYKFEWPATWCYMSVAQCFVALGLELYTEYKNGRKVSSSDVSPDARVAVLPKQTKAA